jgi:2-polyprenyl-3-methyl-5-hydroxy-6-metoxy-1,4-benzoquinol methylase
MNIFKQALGDMAGGRVLDIATHAGGFIQILMENLKSYTEIFGIDISESAIEIAQRTFDQKNIQFIQMDAGQLSFEDASFDTVSISASLHHLADIPQVLAEAKRVLKTGGHLIIAEIHRDGQTEAQLTTAYLHHWVAEVDSALGILHNKTMVRQEIVDYLERLGLCEVALYDFSDTESNPMDKALIAKLEDLIDRTILRTEELSSKVALRARGEELRCRLHEIGSQREPTLVIVGKKIRASF